MDTLLKRHDQLKRLSLFADVPGDALYSIEEQMAWKEFAKGELLYTPSEEDTRLYILIAGRVGLYASHEAKRFVLAELVPGDVFGIVDAGGEQFVPDHWYDGNFAEGLTDGVVASISRNQLGMLMSMHPQFGLSLLDRLRQRLHVSEMIIRELGLGTVEERILGVLMRASRHSGFVDRGKIVVPKKAYTHEGLSAMVGASREAVTRSLSRLQRRGIMKRSRRDYIINQKEL